MDTTEKRQKVSREGVILLKSFEGLRARAEPLEDGRWVIGYGHTLSAREGQTVGEADAELLLQYDLIPVVRAVQQHVTGPLNQHQFDALVSFAFSVGIDRFATSDVLAKINADAPQEAADAIGAWPESTAPVSSLRRRAAERALFVADPSAAVTVADLLTAPLPLPPAGQADAPEREPEAAPEPQLPSPPEAPPDARAAAVAALLGENQAPEAVAEAAPIVILFPAAPQDEPAAVSASVEAEPVVTDAAMDEAGPSAATPQPEPQPEPVVPEPVAPEPHAESEPASEIVTEAPVSRAPLSEAAAEPEAAPVESAAPVSADPEPVVEVDASPAQAPAAPTVSDVSNLALSAQMQRYSPYASPIIGPVPGLGQPKHAKASLASSAAAPALAPPAVTHEALHAGAVSQPAPALVLTPPSGEEAPVVRPVWDETSRDGSAGVDQSPLFDEAAASDAMTPILRHEAEPAPRRFEWSETGAFLIMGGIGLVSFGAAFAAFRRAGTQSIGSTETAATGWVLALIAVLCIGLSGYNLYRRLGRRERD